MISGIAYGLLLLSFIWLLVLIIGIYVLIRAPHKEIGYINWIKKLMVVLYNTVSSFWDIYLNWIIDNPKKKIQWKRALILILLYSIILICSIYTIAKNQDSFIYAFITYLVIIVILEILIINYCIIPSRMDDIITRRINECCSFEEFKIYSHVGKDTLPLLSTIKSLSWTMIYGVIGFACQFNTEQINKKKGCIIDLIDLICGGNFNNDNLDLPTLEAFLIGNFMLVYLSVIVIPNYIYYSMVLLQIENKKK